MTQWHLAVSPRSEQLCASRVLLHGVGVQFRISSFAVRAEFEYFDIDAASDVYMISVGGGFTF